MLLLYDLRSSMYIKRHKGSSIEGFGLYNKGYIIGS